MEHPLTAVYDANILSDDFLLELFDSAQGAVCAAVKRQRESLLNPPKSAAEMLATLEGQGLARTVSALRQFVELL